MYSSKFGRFAGITSSSTHRASKTPFSYETCQYVCASRPDRRVEMPGIYMQMYTLLQWCTNCMFNYVLQVGGDPPPEVVWTKLVGKLPPGRADVNTGSTAGTAQFSPGTTAQLLLQKAEKSDAGVYVCSAKNAAGTATANATLDIHCKCNLLYSKLVRFVRKPPTRRKRNRKSESSNPAGVWQKVR